MPTFFKRAGVVALAGLAAFAITAVGQGLWGVMTIVDIKLTPAIPWAAALMPAVLAVMACVLSGRLGPKAGAARRRALVPLAPVSGRAWTWSLVSGALAIAALAGLWTVLGSIVRTPPNLLPPTTGVPLWTLIPTLLVSITAAPLTEEIAFRGYAMGMLRKHFGVGSAIIISSLLFMAAHLTQGPYPSKLAVYFLVGVLLAVIAWRTGSLLPAAVVHSFGDLVFFTTVWPHDAGRRLVSEGGADAGFYAALALTIVCGGLWALAHRRLLAATGSSSTPAPRLEALATA